MKQLLWTALYQIIDILQALFKDKLTGLADVSSNDDNNDLTRA